MKPKAGFQVRHEKGEYYWILKTSNGKPIARSWNNFTRPQTAERAIKSVIKTMAEIVS